MGEFRPQDRKTYWGNDDAKIQEAELYENRIHRLVEDGMVNPDLRHPWQERPTHQHRKPRISVSLFFDTAGFYDLNLVFNSWSEWKERFGPDENNEGRPRCRRIILMEGVNPRFAELLGAQLGVPPEFWLAHCDKINSLSIVDDKFNRQGRSTYWRASVPQVRGMPTDQKPLKKGSFFVEAGAFDRWAELVAAGKPDQRISFDSLISFWGQKKDKDNWTAIILVDPRNVNLRMSPWNDYFTWQPHDCIPLKDECFSRPNMYNEAARKWTEAEITAPHLRGLYDTIEKAHAHLTEYLKNHQDPFAATVVTRNLIHSIWHHHTHLSIGDINDDLLDDDWEFDELDIEGAIRHTSSNVTFKKYQNALEQLNALPQDYERTRWTRMEERLKEAVDGLQSFMGTFSTRTDMINAVMSERESRSSGQLTKLATVAVPFSVISAIFSMGGDYAAGEKSFGTYWAISVPVTVGLLLWVLLSERLSRKWDSRKTPAGVKKESNTNAKEVIKKWYRAMFPKQDKIVFGPKAQDV
ncbi:hypothetical protein CcaCcLH18_03701 [Colletotrichum camelliae]|nr:hypothetical protein CcaCcLH18_03701 [Colletotrichum camelliae]